MRILIVEDETSIANFIRDGLTEEGFAVDVADNGKKGLQLALDNLDEYDVLLLDWMLPGLNGIEICRSIRRENEHIPIIFLTAKDTVDDAVFGLEAGANDYIRKPFSFEELLARLHALLRRAAPEKDICLRAADLTLDPQKRTVTRAGHTVDLTAKEFAILEYLLRHKGRVISRTTLSEHVWDENFDAMSNVVDVTIYRLREKIHSHGPPLIHTVRGAGYVVREG